METSALETAPKVKGQLSITFRGPFVFSLNSSQRGVDVYAPKCAGHMASVYFGDKEYPIYGRFMCGDTQDYVIYGNGITSNFGKIRYRSVEGENKGETLLQPEAGCKPNFSAAHFHVSIPRPSFIYSLSIDEGQIGNPQNPKGDSYTCATSLRFYYDWDLTDVSMGHPGPGGTLAITPPRGYPLPNYGDIEIRYEGAGSGDPDHVDAVSCFAAIAQLAGSALWLNYNPNPIPGGDLLTRRGADCLAMPMVLGV